MEIGKSWREGRRGYLFAGEVFGRWSEDPADEAVLEHEAAVREVVGTEGPLRAPPVLERGRGWLLERAIEAQALRGKEAIAVAAAAAARIADIELPEAPPSPRGGLTESLRRRALLLRSPLPLRDLVRAKRILRGAGPRVQSHGDFHPGNILFADGAAWVVDWELSGSRPRGYDLMHLWATLDDEADIAAESEYQQLSRLRYAVTVQVIAGKLSAVPEFNRDPEGAQRLLRMLPRLRAEAARA